MMKRLFAFSLVLFLASPGLATTINYQDGQQAGQSASEPVSQSAQKAVKTVSGEVVSIDPSKNEVLVKDETGAEVRLLVNRATKVTKEGKAGSLADVKPSEKVTCDAEESTAGWTAKLIKLGASKTD